MKAQTVTLIGMNRTAVSVGLAIKASPLTMTVVGYDPEPSQAQIAKEKLKAIDKAEWNLINAASTADILIITLPAPELAAVFQVIGADIQPHTLILDLSTMKAAGLKLAHTYLPHGHYVGARPILSAAMLTDAHLNMADGRADLFRNSVFCLMPSPEADPKAVETAVNFGRLLGAVPYFLDPAEYDNLAQGIETVPGLMAAAMFGAIHHATGWRDMLRFADLPFALSTAALQLAHDLGHQSLQDKEATLRWLDALINELHNFRRLIAQGDADLLYTTLTDLQARRAKWLDERSQNDWVEIKPPAVESRGITDQMLGGWLTGKTKKS